MMHDADVSSQVNKGGHGLWEYELWRAGGVRRTGAPRVASFGRQDASRRRRHLELRLRGLLAFFNQWGSPSWRLEDPGRPPH